MKYKTLEINQFSICAKWNVYLRRDDKDRVKTKNVPNSLGFFNYHTLSDKKAFEVLKRCMIERREDEIAKLRQSLAGLKALKFPSGDKRERKYGRSNLKVGKKT